MGERNNGYGSYGELRRTGRTSGACRQDGGCRRTGNDNDCGICRLFGGNDARDGEHRDCGCSQQRTRVDARENRRAENGCGCGCGCGSDARGVGSCAKGECHTLMKKLQQLDFAIQETVLYLDAYPECCEALALYHQLVEQRREVAKQYERECGPLTGRGGKTAQYWDWVSSPWPWSPDFPGNGTGHRS